jgi:hypothetical protein
MRTELYMVRMLKHLSMRGSLFLFVRTHHHLQYYFNLGDTSRAANQSGILSSSVLPHVANVIEIHPLERARVSQNR